MVGVLNKSDILGEGGKRLDSERYLDGAVLKPQQTAKPLSLLRYSPSQALVPYVRHFWFVRWDLRGAAPQVQPTLPLPAVNAVLESDGHRVFGVQTRRFDQRLEGLGAAFGVLFRPAGFQGFWGGSMHTLVDESLSFQAVFGDPAEALGQLAFSHVADPTHDLDIVREFESFLTARAQKSDESTRVARWVAAIEANPTIARAETLAEHCNVSLRTLQRGMRYYVGLGPKPLIRRYRLLEAAARIVRRDFVDQSRLALDLGYSDQSHFVRDFTAVVGRSPGQYAAAQRPDN